MRRSVVSAWTGELTSSCPVLTASVRSALINGKLTTPLGVAEVSWAVGKQLGMQCFSTDHGNFALHYSEFYGVPIV